MLDTELVDEVPTKATWVLDAGVRKLMIVVSAATTVEGSDVTEAIAVWASESAKELKPMPVEISA